MRVKTNQNKIRGDALDINGRSSTTKRPMSDLTLRLQLCLDPLSVRMALQSTSAQSSPSRSPHVS